MNPRRWLAALVLTTIAAAGSAMTAACGDNDYQVGAGTAGAGGTTATTTTSTGQAGAGGTCTTECCTPLDCPPPTTVCIARTCDGQCGEAQVPPGTTSPWQVLGDCMDYICDAQGNATEVPSASDPLDDQNQCTQDLCAGGITVSTPLPKDSPCSSNDGNGGTRCSAAGECVQCTDHAHCAGGLCTAAGVCIPPTCNNNMLDPGETAVDCGGPCIGTCEPGEACHIAADCVQGVCQANLCAAPTCDDLVKNGAETDVDCGGSCPQACGPLQGCQVHADCAGGQCTGTVCIPNCQDGVKNNAEVDVDCGGPSCPDCALGAVCQSAGDCLSGHCADGRCCDTACDTECVACIETRTGAADGTCAPIPQGADPDSECSPEAAATCGNSTGFCGGDGQCEKHLAGTVCGPVVAGSCANGAETTPDACDGQGTCLASTTTPCSPYACGATTCKTSCAGDADCASGAYCAGGACVPKKLLGDPCAATNECTTGHCVDGVCCNGACGNGSPGDCQACDVPGAVGTCSPRPAAAICRAAAGDCDMAEVCNGSSTACPPDGFQSAGTACGSPQSCSSGIQKAQDTCNGSGVCTGGALTACTPYYCVSATTCDTACSSSAECIASHYCNGSSQCVPKLVNGSPCSAAGQCSSGSCVDGVCCNTACGGGVNSDCQACNVPGSLGSCTLLPSTTVCRAAAGVCDQEEKCTGSSVTCPGNAFQSPGTMCGAAYCSGTTRYAADVCNASGTCVDGSSMSCAPGGCVGGACTPCQPGTVEQCCYGVGCTQGERTCGSNGSWGACEDRSVQAVSAGYGQTCALLNNGQVKCWGAGIGDAPGEMGSALQPIDFGVGKFATRIAAGYDGTCARLNDGSLQCWEPNSSTPTTIAFGTGKSVTDVAIGGGHSCALLNDGSVKCWGSNSDGELGQGDTAGRGPGSMGDTLPPVQLGTGKYALAIACGYHHSCALLNDGSVKCWGHAGLLGIGAGWTDHRGDNPGEMGDSLPAIELGTGKHAVAIASHAEHTCALLNDNSVKCWGLNFAGCLGTMEGIHHGMDPGDMGDMLPAVQFGTGRTARSIDVGRDSTCVVLDDWTMKCFGGNIFGQLGVGDTTNRGGALGSMGDNLPIVQTGSGVFASAVSVGERYSCALLSDRTIKCWGLNSSGQLGLGDTISRGDNPGEMGDALPTVKLFSNAW